MGGGPIIGTFVFFSNLCMLSLNWCSIAVWNSFEIPGMTLVLYLGFVLRGVIVVAIHFSCRSNEGLICLHLCFYSPSAFRFCVWCCVVSQFLWRPDEGLMCTAAGLETLDNR